MKSDMKLAASLPPVPPSAPSSTVNGSNNAFPRVRPMHGRTSGPTRRSTRGQWTPEEDDILRAAVQRFKGKNWKKIAECFKERTDVQCLHRWQKVLNPELIKGPWSKEEDEIIVQLVKKYGPKKWSTIAQHLPGRIGKQCRERWHNHLNPAINKEAWTQEEELVLIRAQSLYGNKWAELTKYLPGRTDNAIKNHWNSSVKKKLESYKASGMLAQLEALPLVCHQSQSMQADSLGVQQFSGDGNTFRDVAEGEEISECSQVGCSQTASEMSNTGGQGREDYILSEESDRGKVQVSSPSASCSEQYYTSLDDMTFTIPDIPCEFSCSSRFPDENYSEDPGSTSGRDFAAISLPNNSSLEMAADSSNLSGNYYLGAPNHNLGLVPSHHSVEYTATASVSYVGAENGPSQMPRVDEDCSQIALSQEAGNERPFIVNRCSDMIDMERYRDYISFQTIYQYCDSGGTVELQPYDTLNACLLEASNCEDLSSNPQEAPGQDGVNTSEKELSQQNDCLHASQGQEFVSNGEEGYVHAQNTSSSPSHDPTDVGITERTASLDLSRLVHVHTFGSGTSDNQQSRSLKVKPPVNLTCEQDAGNLCYEPPRFPSLDIPFFSCDLAQSGSDGQSDFSPLGIRQFMTSSASNLTPFKLWDSPSSDESPDAVLKSAAKTFACTPSILKKRHRDLLSPLSPFSERRRDKKTETDVNHGFLCTSRLTKEFSRLDFLFDETDKCKESTSLPDNQKETLTFEDKENICPINHEELGDRISEDHRKQFNQMPKEGTPEAKSNATFSDDNTLETPRGILVECQINDGEFPSPDGIRPNAVEVDSLTDTSKEVAKSGRVTGSAISFVSPQPFDGKTGKKSPLVSSAQPVSSVTTVMDDSLINEVGAENLNFFGGTPFRRSIESPSAWKSPWYFSSLVSGSRFNADITIEDIGIFMSPGERSFDALGLMKQINEQGADAYAEAREVLGSETPDSILKQRCAKNMKLDGQSSNVGDSQLNGCLPTASNVSTERRVLDFSECGTPVKPVEKVKCVGVASPSCLLKSFR